MSAIDRDAAQERAELERKGLAKLIARAVPPEQCGPRLHIAPARPKLATFTPQEVVLGPKGEETYRAGGFQGYSGARVGDVFDKMLGRQTDKDREENGPLFSPAQIGIGRHYAALTERIDAAGVRGVSLETMANQGTGSGGYFDALIDDMNELRAIQRRIGGGIALPVRRLRPSVRGSRVAVRDRFLVDRVCLAGWTVTEVATASGWRKDVKVTKVLRFALAAALDRMQGYR